MLTENEQVLDRFFGNRASRPYLRGAIGQWLIEVDRHCKAREEMQRKFEPSGMGEMTEALCKAEKMFDAVHQVLQVWDASVEFAAEERNEVIR
jgi:hypothetical protein